MFTHESKTSLRDSEKSGIEYFAWSKGRIKALGRKGSDLKVIMTDEGVTFIRRLQIMLPNRLAPLREDFLWWGYIPSLSFQPLQGIIRPWNKFIKRGMPQDKKGRHGMLPCQPDVKATPSYIP
jgi:hypothetical protein